MNKFTNPLENVKVASPCPADWNEMIGDERRRYCAECKLNVYNLSAMTRREAENFIINSEGRVCVKFYRRADGSVLTRDCPVGWQAFRKKVSLRAKAFAATCAGMLAGLFAVNQFSTNQNVADENVIKVSPVEASFFPNKIEDFESASLPSIPNNEKHDAVSEVNYKDYENVVGMLVLIEEPPPKKIVSKKTHRR